MKQMCNPTIAKVVGFVYSVGDVIIIICKINQIFFKSIIKMNNLFIMLV